MMAYLGVEIKTLTSLPRSKLQMVVLLAADSKLVLRREAVEEAVKREAEKEAERVKKVAEKEERERMAAAKGKGKGKGRGKGKAEATEKESEKPKTTDKGNPRQSCTKYPMSYLRSLTCWHRSGSISALVILIVSLSPTALISWCAREQVWSSSHSARCFSQTIRNWAFLVLSWPVL
jgi:hypothetical protein